MPDQNPQAKENHLKVEAMFVSFALRNLDARTEISLLTLGNILLSCPLSIYFTFCNLFRTIWYNENSL